MTVTIITAYYNGRQYLEGYIRMLMRNVSYLKESDGLEAVIVNDSPEDKLTIGDIRDICSRILSDKCTFTIKKDALIIGYSGVEAVIRLIANDSNMGIHASRVRGLEESAGNYVIFLDQDDILRRDAVGIFMENANACAEVLVSNAALGQKSGYLKWYRSKYHTKRIGDLDCYVNVGIQIISPGQCCINRQAIPDEWMEYNIISNGADDYFLWLLMLSRGVDFKYIDEVLYLHSYTGSNLSEDTAVTDKSTYEFCDYLDKIDYFPKRYVDRLRKMVSYKADFRASNKLGKITTSLDNLDILAANAIYKLRTRTPLGFNRR